MGEGSELLEELLDLGVPLDTRVFESDSAEMMNILTTSLSHSWNPEAHEESPTRGSVCNVHPWGVDFQTHAHETSNDEPFATTPVGSILSGTTHHCVQRNVRGEGGFRASTPPTSWPVPEAGVVETALTGDKENGLMNSGRRSTRFRKVTERFDPVNIDAEVCRVADVGRCAQKRDWKKETDVKIAGKRPKLEKMPSLKGKRAVDVNGHLTCYQQPAMRLPSRRAASSHAAKFFKQAAKGNANRGGRAGSSNQSSENAQMERGKHVGSKPQMQKTARAGQRRWKALLSKMRAEAEIIMPTSKNFGKQITECKRLKLKSQKEALLLFLHASARDGLINPGKFCDCRDTASGFIGWTSFTVIPSSAPEFYRKVEDLFGEGSKPKVNTVHNIFRRAGLVPDPGDWVAAWKGEAPFVYRLKVEA